eukprot:gb/GFBE01012497.1/.p1 GENE.gb/GFBE01012497.1/~~gb/GFBE01012497.1/.p1  ORF type:complete len:373 (+),score=53.27 gb/GFBE01012497.1/:1-1119(+)
MPSRKRDRSRTPEVPWELLPSGNNIAVAAIEGGVPPAQTKRPPRAVAEATAATKEKERLAAAKNGASEAELAVATADERDSWRRLVILLAQLRGDRKVEEMLKEKHPELLPIAEKCGATSKASTSLQGAKDFARDWFARGLKGSNQHGPAARAKLCKQLIATLQEEAKGIIDGVSPSRIADVLQRGRAEDEGPLICSLMARDLKGSRYEGLWISRKGPAGHYFLGDEHEGADLPSTDKDGDPIHPRVHAVVKVINEQVVISGFFLDPEDDTMSPAKVPIGPFLSVYFEGMTVREASNAWKNGPPPIPVRAKPQAKVSTGAGAATTSHVDANLKALQAGLPPGWEVRESRSKKGVYFFAHPASGRSQMERPKA